MEEEEFCEQEFAAPAQRFTKWDVLMAFFAMCTGIFASISGFFETLLVASVCAANKEVQKDEFHEAATLAIETISNG